MSAYIDDGYVFDGYVAASPGRYEAVAFKYRPVTRREYVRMNAEIAAAARPGTPEAMEAAEAKAAEWVAKKIQSWDVMAGPHPISTDATNILRLHPIVGAKLFNIIAGEVASDPQPGAEGQPMTSDKMLSAEQKN